MSFFPNESHTFPDLEGGPDKSNKGERSPAEQGESFGLPQEEISERPVGADAGEPQPIFPPQRAVPIMPVMPTVPDQLEQLAQTGSEDVEPRAESIASPQGLPEENENPTGLHHAAARRRWAKLLRFATFETIALSALLIFAKLEVEERFSGNSLTYLYGTVMFIAAIAAALIPVIFYALPPRLPPAHDGD